MKDNIKFAVIGGGSWATAIVKMLTENQDKVAWYMRNEAAIAHLKKHCHNPNYLSAVEFDTSQLQLTTTLDEAVSYATYIIVAVPSAFLHTEFQKLTHSLQDKIIFSAVKGIVPETGLIVGAHFHQTYTIPFDQIGAITGPCHAEEVALERLSYLTIACSDMEKAAVMASALRCDYIKCKTSKDIIGTEYAAMLKNIYAIAAGIAHGLGYGDNFQSVLMSNAIREISGFIATLDTTARNINDSAYLGDLLVTGYSVFSRNRMFGNMIGKGYTVQSAQMEMNMVAEGYYATKSAFMLNQSKGASTPIIDAVYHILYQKKKPKTVFATLTSQLD